MRDGKIQDVANRLVQTRCALLADPTCHALGMDTCPEQGLVGIDVADAAQKTLVEKQRLDARVPTLQPPPEFIESYARRIRAESLQALWYRCAPLEAPELPDVLVHERASGIEVKHRPRVRGARSVEQ